MPDYIDSAFIKKLLRLGVTYPELRIMIRKLVERLQLEASDS
jgi:hypothetical protein